MSMAPPGVASSPERDRRTGHVSGPSFRPISPASSVSVAKSVSSDQSWTEVRRSIACLSMAAEVSRVDLFFLLMKSSAS